MAYHFDLEYDSPGPGFGARHVAPGRFRNAPRNDFLSPNVRHEYHVAAGGGIRRSRSTGTKPVPNIQIFNHLEQDAHPRFDAMANARASPPRTPRGRVMEDEWAEHAHRSPSRGRMFHDHHHHHDHFRFGESPENRATQVALQDQRIRDLEAKLRHENEEELLRMKYDNEILREKREREEAEEKFEKEMHDRLHKLGYSEDQIQHMMKGEKAKDTHLTIVPGHRSGIPTYIKIHKSHLEVATLTYFGLPWEWDRSDSDYIIILKEMDHRETEVLFEHTKSLRRRTTLTIEERPRASGKPELMWVRRRGRSKSAVRNIHIKDTWF
ncbi:hypothetical protein IWX46DRAFT_353164 [Phyllosticta citricarpa]|uniref:Uncharacterized protein n=1 Tax=Phyllosticta citricarpa TaxID=55181 RepID=A0ABR1LFF4_9PEZI